MLVGSTPLRRLNFFLVAPRTPYFDILWSKPSAITKKKVGKNFGLLGTPADWVIIMLNGSIRGSTKRDSFEALISFNYAE